MEIKCAPGVRAGGRPVTGSKEVRLWGAFTTHSILKHAASSTASSTAASSASSEASSEEADEMAAKHVADLIDAIYVQERNEDTDAQCEAAKACLLYTSCPGWIIEQRTV